MHGEGVIWKPGYGETDERGWCMAATDFASIDLPLFGSSAFTRDIC